MEVCLCGRAVTCIQFQHSDFETHDSSMRGLTPFLPVSSWWFSGFKASNLPMTAVQASEVLPVFLSLRVKPVKAKQASKQSLKHSLGSLSFLLMQATRCAWPILFMSIGFKRVVGQAGVLDLLAKDELTLSWLPESVGIEHGAGA